MKYAVALICTLLLCCTVLSGCVPQGSEQGDKTASETTATVTTSTQQPTVTYTAEQMERLNLRITHYRNISYATYKKNYQAVCTRETFCGFYDILLQEDGKRAFVFYDKKFRLYRLLSLEPVKTKQELEDALSKLTSHEQILEVDDNCWSVGSGFGATVHIVQEGFYTLDSSGDFGTETPFIIKYHSNEDVKNDPEMHRNLPFILESDRQW